MEKLHISNVHELITEREKCLEINLVDQHWKKLKGNCEPGSVVMIEWKMFGRDYMDKGYVFCTPECSVDENDCFIHFPTTVNPGGMDNGEEIFDHLYYLMSNDEVVSIEFLNHK